MSDSNSSGDAGVPAFLECARCHSLNRSDASLCANCGAPLSQSKPSAVAPAPRLDSSDATASPQIGQTGYPPSAIPSAVQNTSLPSLNTSPVALSNWQNTGTLLFQVRLQLLTEEVWWLCLCPCCLQPLSPLPDAREIGNEIWAAPVRLQGWSPLFCEPCLRHYEAFHQWQRNNSQREPVSLVRLGPYPSEADNALSCAAMMVGLGCVFPLLLVLIASSTSAFLDFGQAFALTLTVALTGYIALLWSRHSKIATSKGTQRALRERMIQQMTPTCCSIDPPAAWVVVDDPTHPLIYLRNETFLRIFQEINEPVVRDVRT